MSSTDAQTHQLPAWKLDLLSKPSISIRKCIADNYDPPYEDTSTLVLTVHSGKFVDIRLPKSYDSDKQHISNHPSFWAFSGTSKTTFYDEKGANSPGLEYTSHTTFVHDIDSRGRGITDEGDNFLLPNGEVMEVGVWAHNGQLYKEVWTSPVPLAGRGQDDLVKSPVIVAETVVQSTDDPGRGTMIRIGDYVQGVFEPSQPKKTDGSDRVLFCRIKKGDMDDVQGEEEGRWLQSVDGREEGLKEPWLIDSRSNHGELLPYERLASMRSFEVNSTFEAKGSLWMITESSS